MGRWDRVLGRSLVTTVAIRRGPTPSAGGHVDREAVGRARRRGARRRAPAPSTVALLPGPTVLERARREGESAAGEAWRGSWRARSLPALGGRRRTSAAGDGRRCRCRRSRRDAERPSGRAAPRPPSMRAPGPRSVVPVAGRVAAQADAWSEVDARRARERHGEAGRGGRPDPRRRWRRRRSPPSAGSPANTTKAAQCHPRVSAWRRGGHCHADPWVVAAVVFSRRSCTRGGDGERPERRRAGAWQSHLARGVAGVSGRRGRSATARSGQNFAFRAA